MGGETTNDQTRDDLWMSALFTKTRATTPWAMQMHVRKGWVYKCARKCACESVLFTLPVGCSGSLSTVNENNCNKKETRAQKKLCELTSNSIRIRASTKNLKLKANIAILYVDQFEHWTSNILRKSLVLVVCVFADLDGWALQLVLLIRGVSDFSLWQRLCNQIEAS